MSRTFRKPSTRIKAFENKKIVKDGTSTRYSAMCACNGGCPYCESNRLYQSKKEDIRTNQQLVEYLTDLKIEESEDSLL